ncbi:tape measure protein [Faecalibacterium prausnitzii]|uniref:tape measure protein n=1 Tax=Faecalibacterium prausnitzii TaxID=853 RepID=UPI001C038824|nr:tape measure protein [Faecalibacterium prausnitzii]
MDTSAYERGINNVQSETKKTVTALSSEYSKAAKSVLELTKQYNESAAKTGKTSAETKELKNQLAAAEAQLKTTASALKSANNGMDSFGKSASSAGSGLTAALTKSQLLASAISTLSTAALSGAKQFVSMGIEYNAQIESYRVGLTNMLGDAQAANEAMAAIQEDAARTPFSVDSLTQANQLLISAGENAGYSRKVIMALGDAVSATGGGNTELSRMAANLQQIANVGKASAIDIKQFAYAGINVYQVLADYTGKTVQEVQNMTISYDLLSEALIAASEEGGRYYNAMDTQSQTMNGRVSTLKDNVSQLAGLMTGDLSSGIGVVISNLNDMTVAAIDAYKTDGWKGLGEAILELNNPINSVIKKFGELGSAGIGVLDKLSFKLNKALGKNAYAGYENSDEGYKQYRSDKNSQSNYDRRRQDAKNGKGIYNESWTERQAKAAAAAGNGGSSITASGGTGGGKSKKTTAKAATDTKKLADTVTETSKQILAGTGNIVGNIQRVVETADNTYNVYDGTTKKLKGTTKETVETITDSWKEVVDGTEKTIKSVTKKVTDAAGKVTTTTQKTCDDVVLSVTELQSRIDQNLSNAQKQWSNGIFGRLQNTFADLKNRNWAGLATDVAKLIWGEVSQDQRELISKWAADALSIINDAYSGGGVKAAFATIKSLFTDGIAASATEAGTAVQSFGSILSSLSASGGAGAQLANVASGVSSMATSIMGSLGNIVSLVASNPVLAAILGVAAVAGGIGLAAWLGSKNGEKESTDSKSTTLSYKDIQDAYWYGSQRSFAGYDFRTDGYAFGESPANGRLSSYQQKMQQSVDALYNVVQQYLPQTANTVIKLDDGTLVGALAPSIDAQLGHLATLAERGN